jgi:hypothetical protein
MIRGIILLFFFVTVAHAEDSGLHMAQGFALQFALAKGLGASKTVCYISGATGIIFGVLPDLPYKNRRFHDIAKDLGIVNAIPAFSLHLGIDIPWHEAKFGSNWSKNGWLVALDIALWAGTLWIIKKLTGFSFN